MNIIEAIKSGKKFKRQPHQRWNAATSIDKPLWLDRDDIIAEDWEIYIEAEQKIELTWSEINKVLQGYYEVHGLSFNSIKKKLGFKE